MVTNNLTAADKAYIIRSVQQHKIPYITPEQVQEDMENNRVYVLKNSGKPLAMCTIVYDDIYNYYAIKRLLVFKKKNRGKHYADTLIGYCSSLGLLPMGCTPWITNKPMHALLKKHGFTLQYVFDEKWCFFKKSA